MTRNQRREADRIRSEITDGIAEFYEARAASERIRRCGTLVDFRPFRGFGAPIDIPGIPRTFHYLFAPRASPQAYLN